MSRRRHPFCLSSCLLATLLLAAPLAAQQPAPPKPAPAKPAAADSSTVTPQQLAPITTTAIGRGYRAPGSSSALREPALLRDVPQAVTILTRQFVADQGAQSLGDAARFLPGVTFAQGEGHRDAPTIRGNVSTSALFVDGIRDDVQYFRDLYATERLEAVKGPNALMFGRGVGGGILNRVMKVAGFTPVRDLVLQGGSFGQRRGTLDVGGAVAGPLAVRVNALYENTDLFRREASIERSGVLPTLTLRAGARTLVTASYERFRDDRTVDRGIPSLAGVPLDADRRTFFGNAALSGSTAAVDLGVVGVETQLGRATLRSRVQYAVYDKFYTNVFPGAVNAAQQTVAINAYNSGTQRWNALQQTDLVVPVQTGTVRHTLVTGLELGQQITYNQRLTGYFNNTSTSVSAPISSPTTSTPLTFRPSATDGDNRGLVRTAAVFLQDRVELAPWLKAVVGLRAERFDLTFDNRRTNARLTRTDDLLTPRVGLIALPTSAVSVYASYSTAKLPSSGEQFATLTATQQTLAPEAFTNFELGAKAELTPGLALSVAAYQLDRTNTSAPSPNDPAVIVQTGRQRSSGIEADLTGSPTRGWQVVAGYSHQNARITERTSAAQAGARVPIVPRNQASLWNRVDVRPGLGLGLGVIHQGSSFAAIDNSVTLPSWTRVDAAGYVPVSSRLRAQVNVENVLNRRYFPTAHSNNNLTPGAPRLVRVSLASSF